MEEISRVKRAQYSKKLCNMFIHFVIQRISSGEPKVSNSYSERQEFRQIQNDEKAKCENGRGVLQLCKNHDESSLVKKINF